MADATRYRFGIFEVDSAAQEFRRNGLRVKLHAQPFQVLTMLLERPGQILTREEICKELWPEGTFVDYEHSVNSAVNRLRTALGDQAANPRFVETLSRRGYRFLAPVERIAPEPQPEPERPATQQPPFLDRVLASPDDLPKSSHSVVQTLFVLLQMMYLGFYAAALSNLPAIGTILSNARFAAEIFAAIVITAALLIPVRAFLLCAALFHAPGMREKYRKVWPFLLPLDALWSLAPFLLGRRMNAGLALACATLLVYSPFAQRSLILMGAGDSATGTQ